MGDKNLIDSLEKIANETSRVGTFKGGISQVNSSLDSEDNWDYETRPNCKSLWELYREGENGEKTLVFRKSNLDRGSFGLFLGKEGIGNAYPRGELIQYLCHDPKYIEIVRIPYTVVQDKSVLKTGDSEKIAKFSEGHLNVMQKIIETWKLRK